MIRTTVLVACLLAALASGANAQPPITGGPVTARQAGPSLAAVVDALAADSRGAAWAAWEVPAANRASDACCREWRGGVAGAPCCALERSAPRPVATVEAPPAAAPVRLERSPNAAVFVRFEGGVVSRVASFSMDCAIDASGTRVTWLTGVSPAQSLGWLAARLSDGAASRPDRNGVMLAIAQHADAAADRILERTLFGAAPAATRKAAAFWLGAARGAAGVAVLQRALAELGDEKLRGEVVFALSVSPEPGVTDVLLDTARNDRQAHVRAQALFWVAQKAGARVAATVAEAVERDPDTEVKTRAVFALSQLPKDEGVPRLIAIAKTNRNTEVRKQAMFWLGQSRDARALAFFEEVLKRD